MADPTAPCNADETLADREQPVRRPPSVAAAISNAVVGVMRTYTGRGPTHARTTIGPDTVVVTLRDTLTKGEHTLARHGRHAEVIALRRALHAAMRPDLIAAVETLTDRSVEALLGETLADSGVTVEVFLLHAAA
jgi:uncharacterized protein YbcI